MENNKELKNFYKNKLKRTLFIYSLFDEIENEFLSIELFKLSCKYRFIRDIESLNFFQDYNPEDHDSDFKSLEELYYTLNKKIASSDKHKNNVLKILQKDGKTDTKNLEVKKALISIRREIRKEKFIDFSEDDFQHLSKYYIYIIDAKLNLKNGFLKKNVLFKNKSSEKENDIKIDTIFKTSNIYLNIDISKDLKYLIKYIEMVKNLNNDNNGNNDFYLLEKYNIKNRKGLLGDLLYIYDCILFDFKKSWIIDELKNYNEFNIKSETIDHNLSNF